MILYSTSFSPKSTLVHPIDSRSNSIIDTALNIHPTIDHQLSRFMSKQLPIHLSPQPTPPLQPQQLIDNSYVQPFSADNPFTLELAKVQLLLAAISQNTQSPVFALIPHSVSNNNNITQEPLSVDTSTPLPVVTDSLTQQQITSKDSVFPSPPNDRLSSNILQELLTTKDVSQVRTKSNLLEQPGFIPSTTSESGSTKIDDSSDTSSIPHTIKQEPLSEDQYSSEVQNQEHVSNSSSLVIDRLLDILKTQVTCPTSVSDSAGRPQLLRESDTTHLRSFSTPIKGHATRPACSENRPRSYSDLHQITRSKLKRPHMDRTDGLTSNDLESSLFAQLVLSPESLHSPSSSHVNRLMPSISNHLTNNQSIQSNQSQREPSHDRQRLFEWLREADLFVAEHCRDIPLGTLLSVSISAEQSQVTELLRSILKPSSTDPLLPRSAKQVLEKCWHHLLLISLMEHQFYPQLPDDKSGLNEKQNLDHIQRSLTTTVQDTKLDEVLRLLGSLTTRDNNFPVSHTELHAELTDLIQTTSKLNLNAALFNAMRFCVLAQNAYPHHFSTNYKDALSSLENELSQSTGGRAMMMVDLLKLLNRLHCFDADHIRHFLSLSSDPADETPNVHHPLSSSFSDGTLADSIFRFSKRRAHQIQQPLMNSSPVRLRARAHTTAACSKSARLSGTHSTHMIDNNR